MRYFRLQIYRIIADIDHMWIYCKYEQLYNLNIARRSQSVCRCSLLDLIMSIRHAMRRISFAYIM